MEHNSYRLNDKVLFQKVADETVILDPDSGQYFTLDTIGTAMLEKLQEGAKVGEVVTQIMASYDVQQAQLLDDLTELINTMQQKELLVCV